MILSPQKTVLSLIDGYPNRICGTQMFARVLSEELALRGWRSVLCSRCLPSGPAAAYLDLPNVISEAVPEVFTGTPLRVTRALSRLLWRHRPAVVHLHFGGFVSPVPWTCAALGVRKVVLTDHVSRDEGSTAAPKPFWKRRIARFTGFPIDRVIAVSDFIRRSRCALDCFPADRVLTIYNGVDLDRVRACRAGESFRRRLGLGEDAVLVTQVCWMIPEKGVEDLLRAARVVVDRLPRVHFALVGSGPGVEEHRRQVQQAGLTGSVTLLGESYDPFADGVFDGSDIVCQVSRWEEAFGWALAEAMAYGKPVVATRVGGIPEIVQDGVSGFLVNRRDPDGMAAAILTLAEDANLRGWMGAAGRATVARAFDLRRNVLEMAALYGLPATAGCKEKGREDVLPPRAMSVGDSPLERS